MKINLWAGFLIAVFVAVLFGAWYLLQTRHTKPNAPEPDKKAIEAAVQSLLRASKTFSPPSESAAAMTGEFPSGPYQQVNNLVHHLAALPSKKRAAECLVVFREAERLLEDGGREAGEVVAHGLLESVQNITSHADAGAKRVDFERFLGVKSRGEWDRLDELWNQALSAAERSGAKPTMTDEIYSQIESPDLRRAFQAMFRRFPSGRYVSLADIIRFEKTNQAR